MSSVFHDFILDSDLRLCYFLCYIYFYEPGPHSIVPTVSPSSLNCAICVNRSGVGAPVVGDCDGEYNYDSRKNTLHWTLPLIDSSNKSGSMEFSVGGHPDDFFPVAVSFVSKKSYCDIQVSKYEYQGLY